MTPDLDESASLMRVTRFATADDRETFVARGTVRALIGRVLALPAAEQAGLLIRVARANDTQEHDLDAIRELAARPEYTGAAGAYDSAERPEDPDRARIDDPVAPAGPGGRPADPPEPSGIS